MISEEDIRKAKLAITSIAKGRILFSDSGFLEEFRNGCDHIFQLISDSFTLFNVGSYSTSIFLSVTIIEEVSKIHIGLFRQNGVTHPTTKRNEDLLFNHNAKHSIGLQGTIKIGNRLVDAIGENKLDELLEIVKNGNLVKIRESALYTDLVDGKFVTPTQLFSKDFAKNILLLAIEAWDDNLVGYDEHTFEIGKKTDEIFNSLKQM